MPSKCDTRIASARFSFPISLSYTVMSRNDWSWSIWILMMVIGTNHVHIRNENQSKTFPSASFRRSKHTRKRKWCIESNRISLLFGILRSSWNFSRELGGVKRGTRLQRKISFNLIAVLIALRLEWMNWFASKWMNGNLLSRQDFDTFYITEFEGASTGLCPSNFLSSFIQFPD